MGRKGGFQHTCDLLNKYLKEKGSIGELGLGMARALDAKGKPETPRTMNLLPGLEHSGDKESANTAPAVEPAAQMTIFYGGKVMVFENFPAESAREIMAMAGKLGPAAAARNGAAGLTSTSCNSAAATASQDGPQGPPHIPISSDLPIARRVSLNRFLEKRKDRICSKSPYQVQGSSKSAFPAMIKEEVKQRWLGLAPLSPADMGETLEELQRGWGMPTASGRH